VRCYFTIDGSADKSLIIPGEIGVIDNFVHERVIQRFFMCINGDKKCWG
jgi:hypothetical protein